jgi:hypothetical protein
MFQAIAEMVFLPVFQIRGRQDKVDLLALL